MSPFRTVYLGDSVYCAVENGRIKLTTENGYGPSNTIYLEAEVWLALVRYVQSAVAASAKGAT